MSRTLDLKCACGTVKGTLKVVPGDFFHVQCLCCDCQTYASHLDNKENILDEHGASELFQTYPTNMKITEGQDKIACLQLQEKGIYRWHTTCCNMPLANTLGSSRAPFVGISVKLMQFADEQEKIQVLGPISLKAFGEYAIGDMPVDAHPRFPKSYLLKIAGFMLKGLITGKNKPSPFFKDGKPVCRARVLA